MPEGDVLEFSGLTKRFGSVTAVSDFTARVEPGAVTGFLGPNGAGKTTTLRMLLELVSPTSGTATIGGRRYSELQHPAQAVGAVLEATSFHPGRTAAAHLKVYAQAAGISTRRIEEVLGLVGLTDAAGRKVGAYSLGMRQRLALATALLGDPGVLVLDEPTNGLDPEGITWVRTLLRALASEGRTVLVSSHLLSEVQQTVDSLLIIGHGKLVFQGGFDDLLDGDESSVIVDSPDRTALGEALAAAGHEAQLLRSGFTVRGADTTEVGAIATAAGVPLSALQRRGTSLEDAFFEYVNGTRVQQRAASAGAVTASTAPAPTATDAPTSEAPALSEDGMINVPGAPLVSGVVVAAAAVPAAVASSNDASAATEGSDAGPNVATASSDAVDGDDTASDSTADAVSEADDRAATVAEEAAEADDTAAIVAAGDLGQTDRAAQPADADDAEPGASDTAENPADQERELPLASGARPWWMPADVAPPTGTTGFGDAERAASEPDDATEHVDTETVAINVADLIAADRAEAAAPTAATADADAPGAVVEFADDTAADPADAATSPPADTADDSDAGAHASSDHPHPEAEPAAHADEATDPLPAAAASEPEPITEPAPTLASLFGLPDDEDDEEHGAAEPATTGREDDAPTVALTTVPADGDVAPATQDAPGAPGLERAWWLAPPASETAPGEPDVEAPPIFRPPAQPMTPPAPQPDEVWAPPTDTETRPLPVQQPISADDDTDTTVFSVAATGEIAIIRTDAIPVIEPDESRDEPSFDDLLAGLHEQPDTPEDHDGDNERGGAQ